MFYAIRHFTRYRYSRPVWQSNMEVRMHPRSENYAALFHVSTVSESTRPNLFVSPITSVTSFIISISRNITIS